MTKDEALKLALEALEWENCNDDEGLEKAQRKAITAIKQALAAPVQEPVAWMVDVDLANYQGQSEYRTILAWNSKPVWSGTHEINEVLKSVPLYTHSPAARPAPVPENFIDALKFDVAMRDAASAQEPVAIVSGYYGGQCVILPVNPSRIFNSGTAFYTTPPAAQRQWVGLTETEVDECYESAMFNPDIEPTRVLVYQAIEAKLKEKNT